MEQVEHYYISLFEIAEALNSARGPGEVLSCIVEKMAKSLEAKGCALLLLTPDKKELRHSVDYGLSTSYVRKGSVKVDARFREALDGKTVVILDATKDPRIQYHREAEKEGIASILTVPVKLRGEVIGVVNIYTQKRREFSEDDIYFVTGVANLGAIALESARLYDALKKDYDVCRRDILEWRAASGHNWVGGGVWSLFKRDEKQQS